jgi:hypothetical protein
MSHDNPCGYCGATFGHEKNCLPPGQHKPKRKLWTPAQQKAFEKEIGTPDRPVGHDAFPTQLCVNCERKIIPDRPTNGYCSVECEQYDARIPSLSDQSALFDENERKFFETPLVEGIDPNGRFSNSTRKNDFTFTDVKNTVEAFRKTFPPVVKLNGFQQLPKIPVKFELQKYVPNAFACWVAEFRDITPTSVRRAHSFAALAEFLARVAVIPYTTEVIAGFAAALDDALI